MNGSYICVRCRKGLLQKAQRTRGIGFVSLSQSPLKQLDGGPPEDTFPGTRPQQHDRGSGSKPKSFRKPLVGSVRSSPSLDSVLETLFSSNAPKWPARPRARYSGTPINQAQPEPGPSRPQPQARKLRAIVSLRQQLYDGQTPLPNVWEDCERLLSTLPTELDSAHDTNHTRQRAYHLFKDLLMVINQHYIRSTDNTELPPPHEVINKYRQRGIFRCGWNNVLFAQLAAVIKLLHTANGTKSDGELRASDKQLVRLTEEIIHIWSAFARRYAPLSTQPLDNLNGTLAPTTSVHTWFSVLFPRHQHRVDERTLTLCKLTHQCLRQVIDDRKLAVGMTPHGQAFAGLLHRLVEGRKFPTSLARSHLAYDGVHEDVIDFHLQYHNGWGEKPVVYEDAPLPSLNTSRTPQPPAQHLETSNKEESSVASLELQLQQLATSIQRISISVEGAKHPLPEAGAVAPWDKASIYRAATTIIKDLGRAVERKDVARAASIWQTFEQRVAKLDLQPNSREEIYIQFLSSFFALSRQEQAVHVWNHMLGAGIRPNQRHWNAMLSGCSRALDITSLEEIWNKMNATGVTPDQVSWATYIHGLITCRKWERGLQVLNGLGMKWQRAMRPQNAKRVPSDNPASESHSVLAEHDANRPSLIPLQSAVSALIKIGKDELCDPLIVWARNQSIPLTTEFFNILLRPAARAGDTRRINNIFNQLNHSSCSADEATYTILLNAHMSNINSTFSTLTPHEQQDSVLRILDDMTAKNVPINQRTYSTILYGLLNPNNETRNEEAARAVLDHMSKSGIQASHYVYSILVTHYLSLVPPDLQAVEHLWKRIKTERPVLDREFYERMVEGYASAKSIERMLYFLRRIPHEGKTPTWNCLVVVLNALIETGEWGLVKILVDDVQDRRNGIRRFADNASTGWRGEKDFWATVDNVRDRLEGAC
ncbi:MAG: hypothetical protein Q9171_007027 [Xanthocarpia ochracea]